MTKISSLCALINSMNKAEKRQFSMMNGLPARKSFAYLYLLCADNKNDEQLINNKYLLRYNRVSLNNACQYLYRQLLRSIRDTRIQQSVDDTIEFLYADARTLFSRGLFEEGFNYTARGSRLALKHGKNNWYRLFSMLESEYHLRLGYAEITENELSDKQQINENVIATEARLHKLQSLYNQLLYRFHRWGYIRSEQDKERLNDLVVSELGIISHGNHPTFEFQKIHLMFQTIYFRMSGDYQSALRTCFELNTLFESHRSDWEDSPIDYVRHLRDMLGILRSIGRLDEMGYFINRLQFLSATTSGVSDYIFFVVWIYEMYNHIDRREYNQAGHLLEQSSQNLQEIESRLSLSDRAELLFIQSVIFIYLKKYRQAAGILLSVQRYALYRRLPVYRILRLFNLAVHYHLGDYDFMDYLIRSLRRELNKEQSFFLVEKTFLSFLQKLIRYMHRPDQKKAAVTKFIIDLKALRGNIYELQLLQMFDFSGWAESVVRAD